MCRRQSVNAKRMRPALRSQPMSSNNNINQTATATKRVYTEAEARTLINEHIAECLTPINDNYICPFCQDGVELKPLDNGVYQCEGCGYKGDYFDILKRLFRTNDDNYIRNVYGVHVR